MKKSLILYIATFSPSVHGSSMVIGLIYNRNLVNEKFDDGSINLETSIFVPFA